MSVYSYLNNLAGELNIAEKEKDSIEKSVSTLSTRLSSYFGTELKEKFQFGSSVRKTMLPRRADYKSDVDYMIVLSNAQMSKPQTLINRVKDFANFWYSSSEISQSNPTVVLELNHISFDLVPAFRAYDGGSLQIPAPASASNDWIYTYPYSLNSSMEEAHRNSGYELKPALRLLKYWNALNSYVCNSFPLEESMISVGLGWYADVKLCFYAMVDKLYSERYSLPDYKRFKVERAKSVIDSVRSYEAQSMPATAEAEIAKLLPAL
jgi:hypothetical protein